MEDKTNKLSVIAVVGHTFDVMLESMVNSTGYGWCLKSMPKGVALVSTDNVPVRTGVAPVRQIFTFAAMSPLKEGTLEFEMLCLFDLSRPVADTATYAVYIHAEDENDKLVNELGAGKFLKGAGSMSHQGPVVAYGFPTLMLYGYPVPSDMSSVSVIHSNTNCLLKYGNPFGISDKESECNLKYGFPVSSALYKYGFPLTNAAGEQIEVVKDDANCLLKYGTPGGVAAKEEDCILKYGFPLKK